MLSSSLSVRQKQCRWYYAPLGVPPSQNLWENAYSPECFSFRQNKVPVLHISDCFFLPYQWHIVQSHHIEDLEPRKVAAVLDSSRCGFFQL